MLDVPSVVDFWESKNQENDRALAIIGGALIDDQLENLLRSFFIDDETISEILLSPTGAIGANGTRNHLAFALGLIDRPTYQDIKLIAKIRNRFAHVHTDIDFSDNKLQGYVSGLEIPKNMGEPEDDFTSPRGIFFAGVRGIVWFLNSERKGLEKEGRRTEPEPFFPIGNRDF